MRKAIESAAGDNILGFNDATSAGRLCYHIALWYICPIGANFNMDTGLRWLKSAALGGYQRAASSAPILHHHYSKECTSFPHERLFLATGALGRSLVSMDILALKWPSHYQVVVKIIQQRGLGIFDLDLDFNDTYHMAVLSYYHRQISIDVRTMDLVNCLMSYNLERAQQQLEDNTDAGTISKGGIGTLHALNYIRDVDAAKIARTLVHKGANLNAMCEISSGISLNGTDNGSTRTALLSAIRCGQILLAKTLLDAHLESNIIIKDFVKVIATTLAYWQHDLAELLFGILGNKPQLWEAALPAEHSQISEYLMLHPNFLLLLAMDSRGHMAMERRLCHGPRHDEAYTKTIQLLLQNGADPTQGDWMDCPLYRCLPSDDHVSLQCFVKYLKTDTSRDALSHVIDPGKCRGRP